MPTEVAVPPVCVQVDRPAPPTVRFPAAATEPAERVMLPVLDAFQPNVMSPVEDRLPPLTVALPVLGPFLPA